MPWGSISQPSLAMSLLKRCVEQAGFAIDLHYLNIRFAEQLGFERYEEIAEVSYFQTEWFYSPSLFGCAGLQEMKNNW
ncbi:MAG: hypothetical protein ACRD63_17115, partial [Pyrinomonadaceae bacterium]